MGLISKTFTIGCACAGLAATSQMPEFAQQYRQRLAGAVEELRVVVADFDKDAQTAGVTRKQALESLVQSSEKFPRERGASMTKTIDRFDALAKQQIAIEQAEPVSRPLFMLSAPDETLVKGAWEIFEPAVPLNAPGAFWGGFGALLFGLLARIPIGLTGRLRGRRNKIRVEAEPSPALLNIEPDDVHSEPRLANTINQPMVQPNANHSNSLLDQIILDQRLVGEVGPDGRIVIPNRKSTES